MKPQELPSDDPTVYTTEELTKFVNESWTELQAIKRNGQDPVKAGLLEIKIRVCRAELKQRDKHGVQQAAPAAAQQVFWPDFLTSKDLLELPDDPARWIWDRCLPVRATSVLIAREYTGKTKFACSLALCVARGIPFLTRSTQQSAVGFVYIDGPIDEHKDNFQQIGLKDTDPIFHYAGRRPDKVIEWAVEHVRLHNMKLLIIDTMQKFFGFKEGSYEERMSIMQPFLDLVDKYEFHCLFTCHAAKNAGTISALGTVGTEANARVSLYLQRLPDSEHRIFQSRGNAGKNFEQVALTNPMNGIIEVRGSLLDVEIEDTEKKIVALVEDEPGLSETQIRIAIATKSMIVNKALKSLRLKNTIERTGRGRKNDVFKYYMAGQIFDQKPDEKVVDLFPKNRTP